MCYIGGRRRRARDAVRLPARRRRDPAGLRLRPRRLLQPRPAGRQLPGHALERLRQRLPRAVRADRAGVRRRHRRARPDAAGRHGRPGAVRLTAPRRLGRRARRRLAQRPADLQLPLAAPEAQALDEHLRRQRASPTCPSAATAAAGCASRSWPPTRTAARRPSPRRARAWPTAWSATRRASPAVSASRAQLDGLLPGAAVIELQSGLRRDAEHGDVVHPRAADARCPGRRARSPRSPPPAAARPA